MNRQEKIKEYKEYGFSEPDIAKEMNIDISLVRSALVNNQAKVRTEVKSYTSTHGYSDVRKNHKLKMYATDVDRPVYELLYKYGSNYLNKIIKNYGLKPAAHFIDVIPSNLITLKTYFGYNNVIPRDALERITYFSTSLRREVDERDHRECIRCERPVSDKEIRYHKISHPGPMEVNNCATLCHWCRGTKILRCIAKDPDIFNDLGFADFKVWIDTSAAFQHQNNRDYDKETLFKCLKH